MSMINPVKRHEPSKMPRAVNVPAPPAPVAATPMHPVYDEEVLRVAQRDFEQKRMIQHLEHERDDWRRKALMAQDHCAQLEARLMQDIKQHDDAVAKLTEQRDLKIEELTQRRDEYGHKLTRFDTKISLQGKQLIEIAKHAAKTIDDLADHASKAIHELTDNVSKMILETMDELRSEKSQAETGVDLAALAHAIEQEAAAADPMPRVVTAGPAHANDQK